MTRYILSFFLLPLTIAVFAQGMPAYKLYNTEGKPVKYKKMMKVLDDSDIILFGELHNNPITHWLQLEVAKQLDENHDLVMGLEMLEADNQDEVDLYMMDSIDHAALDTVARLWSNYMTDYKPLVDYAKDNDIYVVATNIPRRYASQVFYGGFEVLDTLSDEEKSWMAPLPMAFDPDLPTYQDIITMLGDHGTPELVMAQATKDATMAHFILENYTPGQLFIHYNGAFHSNYYEGILWYLKRLNANLNYATISTVSQENIDELLEEHEGKADFIIVVDEDMTKTY